MTILGILSAIITPSVAAMVIGLAISGLLFAYKMATREGDLCNSHKTQIALLEQSKANIERRLENLEETGQKTNDIVNKIYRAMPKRDGETTG